jgi:hypothetical protein
MVSFLGHCATKLAALWSQTGFQMSATNRRNWLHNGLVSGTLYNQNDCIMVSSAETSAMCTLLSISFRTLLFFPKVFLGFGFWTFINVQKQDMEKSLGKT